jgi:hypothetical protein
MKIVKMCWRTRLYTLLSSPASTFAVLQPQPVGSVCRGVCSHRHCPCTQQAAWFRSKSIVKLVYFVFYVVLGLFDFSLLVVGL